MCALFVLPLIFILPSRIVDDCWCVWLHCRIGKKNPAWVQVQQMCSFSPDIRDVLYKSFQQDNELQLPLSAAPVLLAHVH